MPFDSKAYHAQWVKDNRHRFKGYKEKWWNNGGAEWYKEYMQTDKYKTDKLNQRLKRRYGLTLDEYNSMYEEQEGVCAICGDPPKPNDHLCVDHDAESLKIRRLLCRQCNVGLGNFKHSPELLQKAAVYLELYKEVR